MSLIQTPAPSVQDADPLAVLQSLEWIDWTAITLLGLFFVIGLFKGFWWQLTRLLMLGGAWYVAGWFGPDLSAKIDGWFAPLDPLYTAYIVIFVLCVVVLSLLAMLLQRLVPERTLSALDRVGGGVLGLATGGFCVVLALTPLLMFLSLDYRVVQAADRSQSMHYSRKALGALDRFVAEPIQRIFAQPAPKAAPEAGGQPTDAAGKPQDKPGGGR